MRTRMLLNEVEVKAGQHVKSGQIVASSGNTGHSTAPHLHYELLRGGSTVDPFDYHDTMRRSLPEDSFVDFEQVRASAEALILGEVASR